MTSDCPTPRASLSSPPGPDMGWAPKPWSGSAQWVYSSPGFPLGRVLVGGVQLKFTSGDDYLTFDRTALNAANVTTQGDLDGSPQPLWKKVGNYYPAYYAWNGELLNDSTHPVAPGTPATAATPYADTYPDPPELSPSPPTVADLHRVYSWTGWPLGYLGDPLNNKILMYYNDDTSDPRPDEDVNRMTTMWGDDTTLMGDYPSRWLPPNSWNAGEGNSPVYRYDGKRVGIWGRGTVMYIDPRSPETAPTPWNTDREPVGPTEVTATPPTFSDDTRSYVVTATEGVTYAPPPGTYEVGDAATTVTVTATAQEGYYIAGPSDWSHTWSAVAPPVDPDTPLVSTDQLVRFMRQHAVTQQDAEDAIGVVSAMVSAYCRGRERHPSGAPRAGIPEVVLTASARLVANPSQVMYRDQAGQVSRSRQSGFTGFSLAEQYVLNRYRKRSR